jgi:hypothetical protein
MKEIYETPKVEEVDLAESFSFGFIEPPPPASGFQ